MSSSSIINRVVIGGRAVNDPVSRRVTTRLGDTTKTTFLLRTVSAPKEPGVRIEVEAWAHVAAFAQRVAKGRRVIIDGRLVVNSWTDANDQTQYRYAVRADAVHFLDGPDDAVTS